MQGLQIQLIVCLDRNKAHVLTVNRLGNGFRVQEVVLVRLHKRLHELSGDQPHIVILLSQGTAQEVRSRAGLHADPGGLQVGGKGDQLPLGELLSD